jgi:hypothetical protein
MIRNWGLTKMRHSEQPEANEIFAWIPKRVTSGKLVWLKHYWHVRVYTNVEPKHKWVMDHYYTEWEYFLKKLSD